MHKSINYQIQLTKSLFLITIDFEVAKNPNSQLRTSVPQSLNRDRIFQIWIQEDYNALAKKFYSSRKNET